jgi:hypothetical protein
MSSSEETYLLNYIAVKNVFFRMYFNQEVDLDKNLFIFQDKS